MVTQKEVLKEAIEIAGDTIIGASKRIGMPHQTLYPKVQGKRMCKWEELNQICMDICGKPAYSIAQKISIKQAVEKERQG